MSDLPDFIIQSINLSDEDRLTLREMGYTWLSGIDITERLEVIYANLFFTDGKAVYGVYGIPSEYAHIPVVENISELGMVSVPTCLR